MPGCWSAAPQSPARPAVADSFPAAVTRLPVPARPRPARSAGAWPSAAPVIGARCLAHRARGRARPPYRACLASAGACGSSEIGRPAAPCSPPSPSCGTKPGLSGGLGAGIVPQLGGHGLRPGTRSPQPQGGRPRQVQDCSEHRPAAAQRRTSASGALSNGDNRRSQAIESSLSKGYLPHMPLTRRRVTDSDALKALAHPVRLALLETLVDRGPDDRHPGRGPGGLVALELLLAPAQAGRARVRPGGARAHRPQPAVAGGQPGPGLGGAGRRGLGRADGPDRCRGAHRPARGARGPAAAGGAGVPGHRAGRLAGGHRARVVDAVADRRGGR